jgi:pantetheine-phosphate adenylyltransferase
MKKGIYAGSFDPITIGHIDMIERAARLCDSLTVLVIRNYSKSFMFSEEQRVEMIKAATAHIPNLDIKFADGHLATYVLENGYDVSFRGIRNETDFSYEIQLAQIYAKFYNDKAETVYLMTDPRYSYISSSIVKENFRLGADITGWVHPSTLELMKKYTK